MKRENAFDYYNGMASACLMDFQMIEELLRSILARMYTAADASMPQGMRFRWEPKELDKASLGKLVDRLDQIYGADPDLIADLRRFIPERNQLAHHALSKHLGRDTDAATLLAEADSFEELDKKLSPPIRKLIDILGKLETNN